jgi:hypothetical protein
MRIGDVIIALIARHRADCVAADGNPTDDSRPIAQRPNLSTLSGRENHFGRNFQ